MTNRREFIRNLLIGGTTALVTPDLLSRAVVAELYPGLWPCFPSDEAWAQVPEILKRIKPPVFPKRDFQVTRFGAVGDGKTECTDAFRKAIAACSNARG